MMTHFASLAAYARQSPCLRPTTPRKQWPSKADLEAEQAYIDHAYECLEAARSSATRLQSMVEVGRGGTEQARFEREVIVDTVVNRLSQLQLGDASLCFGRIDLEPAGSGERYYIGRLAVSDETQEPVVVDWRAPVAEPFYRATGRNPMDLARRRHFATRGRQLLGIEDELFGEHAIDLGEGAGLNGQGALISALETARSGRLTDIVATIQGEQDEIIRAPLPGVMVVQGGPGTGKTVVALHRAAYLLYTHRFPLADQGVLVVGPNRLFLAYIEQVLPSLGEAGVELVVLPDLVDDVHGPGWRRAEDRPGQGRLPHVRGARQGGPGPQAAAAPATCASASVSRRSPSAPSAAGRSSATPAGASATTTPAGASSSRRSPGHSPSRPAPRSTAPGCGARSASTPTCVEALERMWPVLTPAQLLHDLFGSRALLRLAGRRPLDDHEIEALHRPRSERVDEVVWTRDDVPLLDEARALLGPKPREAPAGRRRDPHLRPHRRRRGAGPLADAAAHARPSLPERLDDRGRRHRPVHGRVGARRLVRDPHLPPRAAPGARTRSSPSATASRRPNMELAATRAGGLCARADAAPIGPSGRTAAAHPGRGQPQDLPAAVVEAVRDRGRRGRHRQRRDHLPDVGHRRAQRDARPPPGSSTAVPSTRASTTR